MSLSHEDWLLLILADGRWHTLSEILRQHPMTVHSRAASLREKGYAVENRIVGKGAAGSEYRLASLDAAETTDGPQTPGSRGDASHRASASPLARRSSAASNHDRRLGEGEPRRDLTAHPRGSEESRVSPVDARPLVSSPSPSRRPAASSPSGGLSWGAGGSPFWPAADATPPRGDEVHGGVAAGQMTLDEAA